ncbi:hypothetical protein H2201_007709 [Coniosporium apollinis]|uniref:Major facilitator superfamily (MFS) profile domain-containing protein n=1 Tax=Coniosporium apollinis TaxID=61459 RepID=A0ABQ9NQ22_9PEZI|nr:hypothetical protein H2201_007709 [Coniosporium apollinis]
MNIQEGHDLASELNLTPKQVSTGLAFFYICYVIFDLPSNLLMSKLSPHIWMSRIVISVGIIGACMAAMESAWSFYLLRLLLGIVIAGMWPGEESSRDGWQKWILQSKPALTGEDARIRHEDLTKVYNRRAWNVNDLRQVLKDWRLWPLVIMYFGVVGVGIGTQSYGTVIIRSIKPDLTGVQLSLLFAPIWIIAGLLTTTFAGASNFWSRYAGLLIVGFGLGPTDPITMAWTNEIFMKRHGEAWRLRARL